jgi:phthalate 4,5-dioxygenase
MLSKAENELLTRTGRTAPMGRLIRRYWIPAFLSREIPEPDCPSVQVRILGEELVAFRDSQGRIGLLDEHCMHRGTSLFYGRNEEGGLRCIYHGWKYDVEGRVLDTPAEPADSRFKAKLCHVAYPTREINGIVFAYLGPRASMPLFPAYEWTTVPRSTTYVTKCLLDANYLQGLEGECDASHTSFLHAGIGPENRLNDYTDTDKAPRYEVETTEFGLRLRGHRAAGPGRSYVRTTAFLLPLACCVAVGSRNSEGNLDGYEVHFYVPLDDERAWRFDFGFRRTQPITDRDLHRTFQIGTDYRRVRRADNHYLQDREAQRTRDFTGIEDFLNEDACATESMGPIVDRSREHLGASDEGVIALRRLLLDSVARNERGEDPPHVVTDPARNDFRHAGSTAEVIEVAETTHPSPAAVGEGR